MPTSAERLAVIETRLANMDSVHAEMKRTQHEILNMHGQQAKQLENLHAELSKYRGMWGAVVMTVTAMWAVIIVLKDWVAAHWK